MSALQAERDTPKRSTNQPYSYLVKGSVKVYSGSLVGIRSDGYAAPAADTAGMFVAGRANATLDATSTGPYGALSDGDERTRLDVEHGIFSFGTTGGSAITQAEVGELAYVLDDQTVVKAAGTSNNVIAGRVVGYDSASAVWIDTKDKG